VYCQQIDSDFGDEGILETNISNIIGLSVIAENLVINNNFTIQSFSLSGEKNINFGNEGELVNPFNADIYSINQCFIYNDTFTILGCFQNEENSLDLAVTQIDANTGVPSSNFNLSYFEKLHSDEFIKQNIIDDTLRIFGSESWTTQTFPTIEISSNGLFASIDKNGNVVNPDNAYSTISNESVSNLIYLLAYKLDNGKIINFFKSKQEEDIHFYAITDNFDQIRNSDIDSILIQFSFEGEGINQIVQINESNILFTSNTGLFSQRYFQSYILDMTDQLCINTSLIQDLLPFDYQIKDLTITESDEIYLSGIKGNDSYDSIAFICKLNSDLTISEDFGIDGYYEFEVEDLLLNLDKAFYSKDNLFLNFKSKDNEGNDKNIIMKVILNTQLLSIKNDDHIIESRIYPNPVNNLISLNIEPNQEFEKIEIYNTAGQIEQTVEEFRNILNNSLISGVYFLKVYFRNGSSKTFKVFKV